jgi:hypothetical protein
VLVVLGLGAIIEIVEYIVVLTVPQNGVGGYDNNMQDLLANLAGASSFMLVTALRRWMAGPTPLPDTASHALIK